MKLKISEAQVKKAVEQYLAYQQNMGKLLYLRLQSGSLLVNYGPVTHKVNMCGKGTADYVVFQKWGCDCGAANSIVTFLEIKSSTGRQSLDQKVFEIQAHGQNCRYFVVRDANQLEELLK